MKKPKKLIDLVTSTAQLLGYEVIPKWRIPQWSLTNLLRELFHAHKINCVLDVGANTGQYVDYLRRNVGYRGRVISFEPIVEHVSHLRSLAAKDEYWRICDFALGRTESKAGLNVMRCDSLSSFLEPFNDLAPEFTKDNQVERVEEVQIRTMDSALGELNIDPKLESIYLKIDTQGFDLEVIAGAVNSVPFVRALQTEVSCIPIYEEMPDLLETIRVLRELGFYMAGFYPVTRREDLSVVEFDAVFVNGRIPPAR